MSRMIAYEVHVYANTEWKIDSMFDDRALAMAEAYRIERSKRYSGVRVVEESFDAQSQQSSVRTIYRGNATDKLNREATEKIAASKKTIAADAQAIKQNMELRSQAVAIKQDNRSTVWLVAKLVLIAIAGVAAVLGLRYLTALS